jgi:hypothetical protein
MPTRTMEDTLPAPVRLLRDLIQANEQAGLAHPALDAARTWLASHCQTCGDPLLMLPGQPSFCSACLLYAISGEASRLPESVFVLPDGGTAEWLWVSVDNGLKLVTATDAAAFAAVRPDGTPEPQT